MARLLHESAERTADRHRSVHQCSNNRQANVGLDRDVEREIVDALGHDVDDLRDRGLWAVARERIRHAVEDRIDHVAVEHLGVCGECAEARCAAAVDHERGEIDANGTGAEVDDDAVVSVRHRLLEKLSTHAIEQWCDINRRAVQRCVCQRQCIDGVHHAAQDRFDATTGAQQVLDGLQRDAERRVDSVDKARDRGAVHVELEVCQHVLAADCAGVGSCSRSQRSDLDRGLIEQCVDGIGANELSQQLARVKLGKAVAAAPCCVDVERSIRIDEARRRNGFCDRG